MNCTSTRELLALEPTSKDIALQAHLAGCATCTAEQRRQQSLDTVLSTEMHWQAPLELTARLLALALTPADALAVQPAIVPEVVARHSVPAAAALPARPRGWYVASVYALTAVVIAVSLLVAAQLFGALTAQVSFSAALVEIISLPAQGLSYLTQQLPQSRYVIDFLLKVRDQLMWLLLVAVLWAALDKWNIQINFGRARQTT